MGIGASLGNAIGQLPQNQTQQAGRPLGPTQPQMGMGGKGMGQQQPLGFNSLQAQPTQTGAEGTLGMNIAGINPQTGMSPKGSAPPLPRGTLGMALAGYDPQNGGFPQPRAGMSPKGAPDPATIFPNPNLNPRPLGPNPYEQRFGVPGDYVGTPAPQLPPQFMNRDEMRQMAMEQAMPQSTPTTTQPTPEIRRLLEQFSAQIQGRQPQQPMQQPISFDRNRNRNRGPF
jgi:hypothetical protein